MTKTEFERLKEFRSGYVECLEWTEDCVLSTRSRAKAHRMARDFFAAPEVNKLLRRTVRDYYTTWGQLGHDFWLTQNGHGAGFWDRGYHETGSALSDLARQWGSVDIFVDEDGVGTWS